ncbi:MAG TPA: hypothetical protein VN611_17430 [Patescibacteria group bacterium]|nr:hypothetical protein [Patescibacteria group bacterium]
MAIKAVEPVSTTGNHQQPKKESSQYVPFDRFRRKVEEVADKSQITQITLRKSIW